MNIIRPADVYLEQPFWKHLASGSLHLSSCEECGKAHHPPAPICPHCRSFKVSWKPASGNATLKSYTRVKHPVHALLASEVPYVITLVLLEEGVTLVSGLPSGVDVELTVGMPLRCQVVKYDDRFALPYFLPDTAGSVAPPNA
jgi:uncharacterized OB-fold protein